MGRSWKAGVDHSQRAPLVTTGLFSVIRNPFYVGLELGSAGVAALVPNWLALAGAVGMVAGAELVVRLEEEPYLHRVHGDDYQRYRARTGRFLSRLG
jgi:protein-S-isoprenylcysteine O-methyltransferase Ste14